jgi:outer membrane protein assembly factor BamB
MIKNVLSIILLAGVPAAHAQIGRSLDWPTYGGDGQRTGWEKSEVRFTKSDLATTFQLLWKQRFESRQKGPRTLMPPVIIGTLVGYRGFKELAFIGGSDDSMTVVDSDLNRVYWEKRFEQTANPPRPPVSADCSGGVSGIPTLMTIGFRRPAPRPVTAGAPPPRPAPNPMFGPRSIYALSADGKFHRVNVANGEDAVPPVPILPPYAKVAPLNMNDNVIYTTTSQGCGGAPNAVWAIDLSDPDPQAAPKVSSYNSKTGTFGGLGGAVIGTDGTIYAQASDQLLALTPKDLQLKGSFVSPAASVTPVLFARNGKDMIVTAGKDGRLNLLDSSSLAAPVSQTAPVSAAAGGLFGGLSSWEDADGVRWVLATLWGAAHPGLKIPGAKGDAKGGSIVAFKLEEQDGKPVLMPAWTSRDLNKPTPPVIASGVVFALSNGGPRATLYALDGSTGQELWSTGNQVTAPGSLTGLTVANGRVYFATNDNTLWIFGVPLEY